MIIGQITGRGYAAVRYQPTACIVINSPTRDAEIARIVREVWSAPDPSRRLFDALLTDYSTRGKHDGQSLDHWDQGARFQAPAATRLLYYSPDQTAALIAERLDGLDVSEQRTVEGLIRQAVANGVRVEEFIEAVAWSDRPEIRRALRAVMHRTDNPSLFLACRPGADPALRDADLARLVAFIEGLPPEHGPFGRGYDLLIGLARMDPQRARPVYEKFVKGSIQQRNTVCHALREARPAWGCHVLSPLLDDKRDTRWGTYGVNPPANEPRLPIRVCDLAAQTMSGLKPELWFELRGTHEDLDGAIEGIKTQLARMDRK